MAFNGMELRRGLSMEAIALAAVCAGYVGWVLSLPVFPTQDGPLHLYYAHVMSALFSGAPGAYGHFYRIKHLLPPYSAYYYLLIGLSRVMPLLLADKVVICGYIVAFVYGFRYLARAVGPAADGASLLATLVVLNWPLGMGFVNFCLGVAMALWTLGVWARAVGRPGLGRKALFVGMCGALVLVHPLAPVAVMGYCAIDLVARRWRGGREGFRAGRADLVCLLLAMTTLGYVKVFTMAHAAPQMTTEGHPLLQVVKENIGRYARGRGLSLFAEFSQGAVPVARLYRLLVVAGLPVGLGLAIRQRLRNGGLDSPAKAGWPTAGLWLWLTVAMVAVEPFIPQEVNASHFFGQRLLIFLWVGALLAMSGYVGMGRAGRVGLVVLAVLGMVTTLATVNAPVRAVAWDMARVERMPVEHRGELGLTLEGWTPEPGLHPELTYNPYLWASAHYFRYNDATMYNTPFMDQAWIPLGKREGLATDVFSPKAVEDPRIMRKALADPAMRATALREVRFVVESHAWEAGLAGSDPLLPGWGCGEEGGWYVVCAR